MAPSGSSDVLSPEQRSKCMSRIRGKDTGPEVVVRKLAHRMGCRFVLHAADLPGTPDLVFPRHNKIVFVHGCFWHRHWCKFGCPRPKQNAAFWEKKLQGNVTVRPSEPARAKETRLEGVDCLGVSDCSPPCAFPQACDVPW